MHTPHIPRYRVTASVRILAEVLDYNHRLLNTPDAWLTTQGEGVRIAIIDTGLPEHVDLVPAGGRNFTSDPDERDGNGHSTHVGGIIHATANNGLGVAGIAPKATVIYGKALTAKGSGLSIWIANAIDWAIAEGVHIISESLGLERASREQPFDPVLRAAHERAAAAGIVIVCAAGNNAGLVNEPAAYPTTIGVASVNSATEHSAFSSTGPEVDLAAGGEQVYSTYPTNRYAKLSGTSMATPVITGAAALIIASHLKRGEKLSPADVLDHMKRIAHDIGPAGVDDLTGAGIPLFGKDLDTPAEPPVEPPAPPAREPKKSVDPSCFAWQLVVNGFGVAAKALADGKTLEQALAAAVTETGNLSSHMHVVAMRAQGMRDARK